MVPGVRVELWQHRLRAGSSWAWCLARLEELRPSVRRSATPKTNKGRFRSRESDAKAPQPRASGPVKTLAIIHASRYQKSLMPFLKPPLKPRRGRSLVAEPGRPVDNSAKRSAGRTEATTKMHEAAYTIPAHANRAPSTRLRTVSGAASAFALIGGGRPTFGSPAAAPPPCRRRAVAAPSPPHNTRAAAAAVPTSSFARRATLDPPRDRKHRAGRRGKSRKMTMSSRGTPSRRGY